MVQNFKICYQQVVALIISFGWCYFLGASVNIINSPFSVVTPSKKNQSPNSSPKFNFSIKRPSFLANVVSMQLRRGNSSLVALRSGIISKTATFPLIRIIGKPFRDLNFWGRALHIYGSYKIHQVKAKVDKIRNKTLGGNVNNNSNYTSDKWHSIHEVNSKRMINLCLGLRGFYLKTGQFLGTRHDFMPKSYTSKLCRLHDNVPPLEGEEVKKILEKELGGSIEQFFTHLNLSKPIGAASIAQVHVGVYFNH